jgi:hypothetical protein
MVVATPPAGLQPNTVNLGPFETACAPNKFPSPTVRSALKVPLKKAVEEGE